MHCVVKVGQESGRVFGCHRSPQAAYAQIAAIEASEQKDVDSGELDRVFAAYHDTVNMSASELEAWGDTEASQLASQDRSPIRRNLRLLRTPKSEWTQRDIDDANKTISFVARMSAAEQGEPVITQGTREYSKRDISLLNWAYDPKKTKSFTVNKQRDGRYRWAAVTSTAYLDRDNEIVSREALRGVVERGDRTGERGVLRWWHEPGIDLGTIDFQALHDNDRLLVESGTFASPVVGEAVAAHQDDLGLSIGFWPGAGQPDTSGVFTDIRKFETSLLPKQQASNRFTNITIQREEKGMRAEKINALRELLSDDDTLQSLLASADNTASAASSSGLHYKNADTIVTPDGHEWQYSDGSFVAVPPPAEPEPEPEPTVKMTLPVSRDELAELIRSAVMAMMDSYTDRMADKMREGMEGYRMKAADVLQSELATLKEQRAQAEQTIAGLDARLKELEGEQPRAATSNGYRPTQDDSTVVGKAQQGAPQEDTLEHTVKDMMATLHGFQG